MAVFTFSSGNYKFTLLTDTITLSHLEMLDLSKRRKDLYNRIITMLSLFLLVKSDDIRITLD